MDKVTMANLAGVYRMLSTSVPHHLVDWTRIHRLLVCFVYIVLVHRMAMSLQLPFEPAYWHIGVSMSDEGTEKDMHVFANLFNVVFEAIAQRQRFHCTKHRSNILIDDK